MSLDEGSQRDLKLLFNNLFDDRLVKRLIESNRGFNRWRSNIDLRKESLNSIVSGFGLSIDELVGDFDEVFDFFDLSDKGGFVQQLGSIVSFPLIKHLQDEGQGGVANLIAFKGLEGSFKDLSHELAAVLVNKGASVDSLFTLLCCLNIAVLSFALLRPHVSKREVKGLIKVFKRDGLDLSKREARGVIIERSKNLVRNGRLSLLLAFFNKSLVDLFEFKKGVKLSGKQLKKQSYVGVKFSDNDVVDFLTSLFFKGGASSAVQVGLLNEFKSDLKQLVRDRMVFDGGLFQVAEELDDYFAAWLEEVPVDFNELVKRFCNKQMYAVGSERNVLLDELHRYGFRERPLLYFKYLNSMVMVASFIEAFLEVDDVWVPFNKKARQATELLIDAPVRINKLIKRGNRLVSDLWVKASEFSESSGLVLNSRFKSLPELSVFDWYSIVSVLSVSDSYVNEELNALLFGDLLLHNRVFLKGGDKGKFIGFERGEVFSEYKSFFVNKLKLSKFLIQELGEYFGESLLSQRFKDFLKSYGSRLPFKGEAQSLLKDLERHLPVQGFSESLSGVSPLAKGDLGAGVSS